MKELLYCWMVFTLSVIGVALMAQTGTLGVMYERDHTMISLITIGLFLVTSGALCYQFGGYVRKDEEFFINAYWFMTELFMGLGLVGTTLGFIYVFQNVGDIGQSMNAGVGGVVKVLAVLLDGMGTILFATAAGLIASFALRGQLMIVEARMWREDAY